MRGPLDLSRELLDSEVLHEFVHLRRRIDEAGDLPDVLGLSPDACVQVRLYDTDDGGLVAALAPPNCVVSTGALADAASVSRVRATPAARVSATTDYHPSLVAPVGLPPHVAVFADASLGRHEVLFTPTGDGSIALKIRSADLLALTGAKLIPLVEPGAAVTETPARTRRP